MSRAAPLIVEAANAIFSRIRKNKGERTPKDEVGGHDEQLAQMENRQNELYQIDEEQSKILRDLAEQNQKLILATRNTQWVAFSTLFIAAAALLILLV